MSNWTLVYVGGHDSSVSIATHYGLDGPVIESRWEPRISAPVQTGPGAYTASCTMGYRVFPGGKAAEGVVLTTHPHLSAEVMKG